MKIGNPNTEPLATYNDGSNPREGYNRTCSEKAEHMVKRNAGEINTCVLTQSIWVENNASKSGRDNTVNTTTNNEDVVSSLTCHAEPMNKVAGFTVSDKGTTDDSMTNVKRDTGDGMKEFKL